MYRISDQQIDYILSDISARGVELESLQQNLVDHICCIIENNLEENGDFEGFYQNTIKTFYKDELWEIEEETLRLLTFKNYYTMKKVMIVSGTFSAAAMILGILFKFMHWPGAGVLIVLGISISSLIFLPLLFTLKLKEQQDPKDKIALGLVTLSGILLCLSVLFKVMHWPGANMMGVAFLIILGLIFLPLNFYSGIRNPERKINTITTSILIIIFCGLWLTLIRSPHAGQMQKLDDTYTLLREEQLLAEELSDMKNATKDSSIQNQELAGEILNLCADLKALVLKHETGFEVIPEDFESKNAFVESHDVFNLFASSPGLSEKIQKLNQLTQQYNEKITGNKQHKLPVKGTFLEYIKNQNMRSMNTINLIRQITNLQLFVVQNQRT